MSSRFEVCHAITAKWEGGKVDHKDDPGGKTNYGVTEAVWFAYCDKQGWPRTPVFNITKAQSEQLFLDEYWRPSGAERLFNGVDLAHYDAAVNSGVGRAKKWLLASVGSNDHAQTVVKYCRQRLSFLQLLKIWKVFGRGWANRVADIEAKGVAMALAAQGRASDLAEFAARQGAAAKAEAKANEKRATTTVLAGGGTGGGAATVDATPTLVTGDMWEFVAVVGIIAVILFVIFYKKREAALARAKAYHEVSV